MENFGKIAVGCRMGDRPDPRFVQCLLHLAMNMRRGDVVLAPVIELPAHWAACAMAKQFLTKTTCDTLLMLDDDMTFTPDHLAMLRDNPRNWSYGIVQGLCVSSKAGHGPIVLMDGGGAKFDLGDETVETLMTGLAFTLVRRSTFEAVRGQVGPGSLLFAWQPTGRGEDHYFCHYARAAGVRCAVDGGVVIGHRLPVEVTWNSVTREPEYSTYTSSSFFDLIEELNEKHANQEE